MYLIGAAAQKCCCVVHLNFQGYSLDRFGWKFKKNSRDNQWSKYMMKHN